MTDTLMIVVISFIVGALLMLAGIIFGMVLANYYQNKKYDNV